MTDQEEISSKEKVGGEKASKSSSKSSSKKKKGRASVSTDEQGTSGTVGEGDEKKKSRKGRASVGTDDGPEEAEHPEKGDEGKPKSKSKKPKDSQKEKISKRDKEEGVDSKLQPDASPKKKRRRSSKKGGETGEEEEQKEAAEAERKPKSSPKKKSEEAGTATKKEGDGAEVKQRHSTSKSGEHRKKDGAASISDERKAGKSEDSEGNGADESSSKPKSRSRKHSARGSISIDAQGDSVREGDNKGGREKGGEEREAKRKDSTSGSSKKKKERRSSKNVDSSNSGGPEPEAVPDAANVEAPVVATEEASRKDKSKRRESKEKDKEKEEERDTEGHRSRKKKEKRRSSASRKEKQASSSKNMEPGESSSLAPQQGDGALGAKSGAEVGDGGSKAVDSLPVLVPEAKQIEAPVTDEASVATTIATNGETPTKQSSSGGSSDGTTAAKAAAVVEATESPSSSETKGATDETATASSARTNDGVSGGPSEPEDTATGTGGPVKAPSTDGVASREAKVQETSKAEAHEPPAATAPPKKVILSGSGATLPASILAKEAPPEAPLDSTPGSPKAEAHAGGVLTERKGAGNGTAEGAGGAGAREGSVSPTPPRTRSNPISRGTPPQRGSRGGNLAICTQQPYSSGGEDGRDWPKPSSPRSRPRDQPLVRAKNDARGGGGGGTGADGSGNDGEGGTKEKVASFSSRRWKASDEYVLDEDRETPRGGVFAKIPGLDQHLIVETKKMNDPPRFRPPKLISGTVRQYDPEEASEAAFRYPECRGAVFRPSYADDGSFDDLPASSPLLSEPPHRLRLERAHGYHGGGFYPSTDTNAYFLGEDRMPKGGSGSGSGSGSARGGSEEEKEVFEVVYPTAALVVMHKFRVRETVEGKGDKSDGEQAAWEGRSAGSGGERGDGEMTQRFFDGHTDDVTAVAVHPGGVLVASGQVGRSPNVLVWSSSAQCSEDGAVLNKKQAIIATLKGHERKICCLDFSPDGWLLCAVGADCKSTTNIWDWRKGVAVATVQAGPGPIHAFRFNPYQSYGAPSKKPVPGQALHIDDACYCLVSIGVRHCKFWLLTRGLDNGPVRGEIPPVLANAKWTSSQRVQEERVQEVKGRGNLRWIIDGSSARLNGKGSMADFTCVTFIDDSPPLQTWGAKNTVVDSLEESDRSSGRVVLGTAAGDLYIFIQRGVRLIPREFAKDVKRGKGGSGIFLDPWWLFGPGHEVTANKRLWDLGAELVDNIPHSKEAANELVLSDKAKDRVHALEQKMAVKPLHPAVFEELKRLHDRFSYTGPLTGHEGGVSALAFNRETGKVVSAGTNGEIVQWQAFFFDPTTSVVSPTRRASGAPVAPESGGTPAPATPLINNSLVGLINERRNRNEEKIQRSLRSRNPSEPTLRRVGHQAPRGDGRMGGVDVFEMDYRTTLGREDEGELSLSGPSPSSHATDRGRFGPSPPSRVDMFGVSGRRDGFESSGSTRGSFERSASEDAKRRSKSGSDDEGSSSGGMGIRFEAGVETGLRVELDMGGSRERSGQGFGLERGIWRGEGEAAEEGWESTPHGGGQADCVSRKRSVSLPRGSHGKSLVWSKDGKHLLTGVNTNILLLLEYPGEDRDPSSDRRVGAVSPRGRSISPQQEHQPQAGRSDRFSPRSKKPSVRHLVQGHSGSVSALAVFEGMHEYVTAGYDRSVAVWNAASNLPVAWCSNLPSPVSCLACSPDLEEVAVGTVNTNEILFLKVRRRTQGGPASSAQEEGNAGAATHVELHDSKQLLPASAWAKSRRPGPNSRWITTAASWDRFQIVTLDGKDTPHVAVGGAASNGGTSGGGVAASNKPNSATKMSPVRARARSASLGEMGNVVGGSAGGNPSTPPRKSPSRPPTMGASPGTGDGGGAGFRTGERGGRRGRRRYSDGGEPQRGMGATCMRYSPSGSHLAIGCKNGSLVIMAVEASSDNANGAQTTGDDDDTPRHTGPEESGHPLSGQGAEEGEKRTAELSAGIEGRDDGPWSPSSRRRRPRERRRTYRRIAHLKGHSSRVHHLDWTVDGRFVHTCGQDYQILHWEILPPPPHRRDEGAAEEGAVDNDGNGGDDDGEAVAGEFRPRMFKRAFLVRDEQWATWSSVIGWPVQGVFPAYSDNTDVNAVDVCADRDLLVAADDAKTIRLLRYPVLRGGARNRSYTAHSSHVMGARFTVGVEPTRLITLGGMDSTIVQWVVEDASAENTE